MTTNARIRMQQPRSKSTPEQGYSLNRAGAVNPAASRTPRGVLPPPDVGRRSPRGDKPDRVTHATPARRRGRRDVDAVRCERPGGQLTAGPFTTISQPRVIPRPAADRA